MVSSKVGVQNWSKAQQTPDFKREDTHFAPAAPSATGGKEEEKNIGEKLNQIANPGGKDPTKQMRKSHNTLDKDDFMKLMLTQMKNQDPMSPLQSHEMAAQLAQFTSLEQLFNVNKNLEGLSKSQDPIQKYEALNFLGKTVKSDSREILRTVGDTTTDLRFSLGADAMKGKLSIMDDQGQIVKTMELGSLKAGANKVVWSGADGQDRDVKPGHYMFSVEAENSAGRKIAVQTATHGTITGVNYTSEGPLLMIGDQKVRLQDVQKIEDENLKQQTSGNGPAPAVGMPAGSPFGISGPIPGMEMGPSQNSGAGAGFDPAAALGAAMGAKANGSASSGSPLPQANLPPQAAMMNAQSSAGPMIRQADHRPKVFEQPKSRVKPEDKPEAKLTGSIMPLEVASANQTGAGHINGGTVNTGGPFAHR